ncbi:F-box family protein [Rhynchospora pubera]|uniref:F-box family protein n=1 Tax=Rhynchospora pubera TaxID=906938 RepID=A0AAV8GCY9_9POAL|nr:F-box family protein [Rhynchospora pubera]
MLGVPLHSLQQLTNKSLQVENKINLALTMDGDQSQNKRTDFKLNPDFLSSLPSEILANILVKLPIKEAVRTSILSSKWKYSWTLIPDLVFKWDIAESELTRIVDKVLLVHQGPILKFVLNSCQNVHLVAIHRWLLVLSKFGLKHLRFSNSGFYCLVPSSLFSCHKLEHLDISCGVINAPQCFQGFKFLRYLDLCGYKLLGITIEKIVSGCPLLESLTLSDFVEHGCLVIRAPNLVQLHLEGTFTNLLLETPKLISLCIFLFELPHHGLDFGPTDDDKSKFLCTISALPRIEELKIGALFCEYLASGSIPKKLPVTFHHLKKILVYLDGTSKEVDAVDAALCIFRNAPNLKKLCLTVPSQVIWEEQRITSFPFLEQLEVVKVLGFENVVSMLGFAKFILSTAPQLRKLVIHKDNINELDDGMGFLMKLASLTRLSSKAAIVFSSSSRLY